MPLLTFSDPGSENYGIANAQSTLRQMLDPSLIGTMQHRWMRKHSNIKPEIAWSQFRARCAHELEPIFDFGVEQGWYDPHNVWELYVATDILALQVSNLITALPYRLVFRFVAMPVVQAELDAFVKRYNSFPKRANNKTLLPHGRPKYIYQYPSQYKAFDFKVMFIRLQSFILHP